jgi:hypothetical protein
MIYITNIPHLPKMSRFFLRIKKIRTYLRTCLAQIPGKNNVHKNLEKSRFLYAGLYCGTHLMLAYRKWEVCLTLSCSWVCMKKLYKGLSSNVLQTKGIWSNEDESSSILMHSHWLWTGSNSRGNIQSTLINSHATLGLVWQRHDSWWNSHANSWIKLSWTLILVSSRLNSK